MDSLLHLLAIIVAGALWVYVTVAMLRSGGYHDRFVDDRRHRRPRQRPRRVRSHES
jgi:hypothetical protein